MCRLRCLNGRLPNLNATYPNLLKSDNCARKDQDGCQGKLLPCARDRSRFCDLSPQRSVGLVEAVKFAVNARENSLYTKLGFPTHCIDFVVKPSHILVVHRCT